MFYRNNAYARHRHEDLCGVAAYRDEPEGTVMTGRTMLGALLILAFSTAFLAQTRLAQPRLISPASLQSPANRTDVSAVAGLFFDGYCIQCHNRNYKSGEFALDSLNMKNVAENIAVWEKIVRRLRARSDPPAGVPRPDERTYRSVIARFELALDQAYSTNDSLNIAAGSTTEELAARMAAFNSGKDPDARNTKHIAP